MKKVLILSLLVGAAAMTSNAQTDFRHISFDEALKAAQQEQKMLFVDFYTDWCGPCKKMSAEVFPQKNVGDYMNKNFVSLKLNAEKEGAELAQKYKVAAYPTFVIIGADGKEITKVTGYREGDEFIAKIKSSVDPEQSPEYVKKRFAEGDRSPKVVNAYVMSLLEQRKDELGLQIIGDYFKSLSDADRLNPDNTFIYTRYTFDLNSDAARFMVDNLGKFDKAVRPEIDKKANDLYHAELAQYFSGYIQSQGKFDRAAYDKVKNEIKTLGLDKKYNYGIMFDFIETRMATDDNAFLAYCEKRFNELESQERTILLMNVTRLFNTKNPEMCKNLSNFLRSRLSTMSPIEIQFAGRVLGSLESNH